jgi:hypothetical protein
MSQYVQRVVVHQYPALPIEENASDISIYPAGRAVKFVELSAPVFGEIQ